ncbi:UPAR/Ly6 domain-containing protein crok-like [Rhodnius prolixus]|uniref:UPAR/Ly6 domain-containing protein crok-like n=1 Tax=Rhodnius prolixus TaxID=13249 RepID=UPI003D18C8E8
MYAFILFVIVAFTINTGCCIKCYDCDSVFSKKCLDPFVKNEMGQTDCSSTLTSKVTNLFGKLPGVVATNEFICVKTNTSTVLSTKIVRSCVLKPEKNNYCEEVKKKWLAGTVHFCGTCESDGCNGAGKLKEIWLAIIVASLVCVFQNFYQICGEIWI